MGSKNVAELLMRVLVKACIQERDRVVVVLFRSKKRQPGLLQLPLAGLDVHPAPLLDLNRCDEQQFFKSSQRLFVLAMLQQLNGSLKKLKGRPRSEEHTSELQSLRH